MHGATIKMLLHMSGVLRLRNMCLAVQDDMHIHVLQAEEVNF